MIRGLQPKAACIIGLKPGLFSFLPLVKTNGNECFLTASKIMKTGLRFAQPRFYF
jgi:hypothetical protein